MKRFLHTVSGSSVKTARHCAFPFFKDHGLETEESDSGKQGTAIHKYAEDYLKTRVRSTEPITIKNSEGADVLAESDYLDALYAKMDELRTKTLFTNELRLVYNPEDHQTRLVDSYERLTETPWIPGTADFFWMEDGILHVFDLKTSQTAKKNYTMNKRDQLLFYALAVAAHLNYSRSVKIGYMYVDGTARSQLIGWGELEKFRQSLVDMLTNMPQAIVSPGEHCLHCNYEWQCEKANPWAAYMKWTWRGKPGLVNNKEDT